MSAHDIHVGHADHHEEHDDLHVTAGDYVKGFILAVILTVIPFWLVMADVIQDRATVVMVLGIFAIVQVIVHMVYFLHMNGKLQGGWTLMSTIFSIVFVMITIAGTLWVMFHMNANMMPSHAELPAMEQHSYQHAVEAPVAVEEVLIAVEAAPVAEEAAAPAAEAAAAAPAVAEHAAEAAHTGHGNNE